jgi:hypothetical protein
MVALQDRPCSGQIDRFGSLGQPRDAQDCLDVGPGDSCLGGGGTHAGQSLDLLLDSLHHRWGSATGCQALAQALRFFACFARLVRHDDWLRRQACSSSWHCRRARSGYSGQFPLDQRGEVLEALVWLDQFEQALAIADVADELSSQEVSQPVGILGCVKHSERLSIGDAHRTMQLARERAYPLRHRVGLWSDGREQQLDTCLGCRARHIQREDTNSPESLDTHLPALVRLGNDLGDTRQRPDLWREPVRWAAVRVHDDREGCFLPPRKVDCALPFWTGYRDRRGMTRKQNHVAQHEDRIPRCVEFGTAGSGHPSFLTISEKQPAHRPGRRT